MHNNKCEKSSRRKKVSKNGVISSDHKDNVINDFYQSKFVDNPKDFTEISAKIVTKMDKISTVDSHDDSRNKSFLKMSVKMNSYVDENVCVDDSPLHYKSTYCQYETNGKSKCDKVSQSPKRCCSNNSTKIVKCKSNDAQFHVSIKSRNSGKKIDLTCCERHSEKHVPHHSSSLMLENDPKILRLDFLLQFLDQMREMVVSRELSIETFRSISERLIKDKMNIEMLLLTDLIIRTQVHQMTKLISKDLCQHKVTPPVFVKSFLKQYRFLKSLSQIYKQILTHYESTYLAANSLSFDLICRTYFKILIHDCPKIKEHIVSGHLNVKLEQIYDSGTASSEREQIKVNYATLKSDFQDNKWRDINKTIRTVLDSPDDIVKSFVNVFNVYFAKLFSRSSHCKKGCCDHFDRPLSHHIDGSYLELLRILPNLPNRDSCSKPHVGSPSSLDCIMKSQTNNNNNNFEIPISRYLNCSSITTSTIRQKTSFGSMYEMFENIKPPSISCSSSSNKSNGYNSCLSISSYEDSSDDDNERFFQKWKRVSDLGEFSRNEETKPPTPASLNDDDDSEIKNEDSLSSLERRSFRIRDCSDHQDEILKFDKDVEQYLAENEHLLDTATLSSSTTHMSVPDYLTTLEKADSLQSKIKVLMSKNKKKMDSQEKINQQEEEFEIDFEELSRTFSSNSTTRENLEELEKFLDSRFDVCKGKTHPNLQALVKTCRLYCNKLYKCEQSEDHLKKTDSETLEVAKTVLSGNCKQAISGDESFDLPFDCASTPNTEADFNQEVCSNNNTSVHNNMSSSETGSSSASTENTSNNKVCNCCKCEMFGEQSFVGASRATNVVEKLRIKLKQRRLCSQKTPGNRPANCLEERPGPMVETKKLPDVDTLVEFINGPDKTEYAMPQTPDVVRSFPKKNKPKSSKAKTKKVAASVGNGVVNGDGGKSVVDKNLDLLSKVCLISKELVEAAMLQAHGGDEADYEKEDLCHSSDEAPEKDAYDPVVEDFKRFCSTVVVPEHRKKLPIDASLLIGEVRRPPQGLHGRPTRIAAQSVPI